MNRFSPRTHLLAAAAAFAALVAMSGPAAAQTSPPSSLILDRASGESPAITSAIGQGFTGVGDVTIAVGGIETTSVTPDAAGAFTVSLTITGDPGPVAVEACQTDPATGDPCGVIALATFTITPPTTTTTSTTTTTLPPTTTTTAATTTTTVLATTTTSTTTSTTTTTLSSTTSTTLAGTTTTSETTSTSPTTTSPSSTSTTQVVAAGPEESGPGADRDGGAWPWPWWSVVLALVVVGGAWVFRPARRQPKPAMAPMGEAVSDDSIPPAGSAMEEGGANTYSHQLPSRGPVPIPYPNIAGPSDPPGDSAAGHDLSHAMGDPGGQAGGPDPNEPHPVSMKEDPNVGPTAESDQVGTDDMSIGTGEARGGASAQNNATDLDFIKERADANEAGTGTGDSFNELRLDDSHGGKEADADRSTSSPSWSELTETKSMESGDPDDLGRVKPKLPWDSAEPAGTYQTGDEIRIETEDGDHLVRKKPGRTTYSAVESTSESTLDSAGELPDAPPEDEPPGTSMEDHPEPPSDEDPPLEAG